MSKPVKSSYQSLPSYYHGAGYPSVPQAAPQGGQKQTVAKTAAVVSKKRKAMATATTGQPVNAPLPGTSLKPSAFSSPVRKPLALPGGSPQKADPAKDYHFSRGMENMKERDLKKLAKKPMHTLAPDSAEDPIKIAARHWTKIKEARKQLSEDDPEIEIQVRGATLTVSTEGILVETKMKSQMVDFHQVERRDGPGVRPFPKASLSGNPSFTLPGAIFEKARRDFDRTPTPPGGSQSPFYNYFKDQWYPDYQKTNSPTSEEDNESDPSDTPMTPSPSPTLSQGSRPGSASPATSPEPEEASESSNSNDSARPAKRRRKEETLLPFAGSPPAQAAKASPQKAEKPKKLVLLKA